VEAGSLVNAADREHIATLAKRHGMGNTGTFGARAIHPLPERGGFLRI